MDLINLVLFQKKIIEISSSFLQEKDPANSRKDVQVFEQLYNHYQSNSYKKLTI